jgi:hypothetical protein
MNYPRIVVAAVAATVIDVLYGIVVWGQVLRGEFARYPDIYRPGDDQSALPLMVLGLLVGMFFASWIYAKGYEGGSGLIEGLRFGGLMGLLVGSYMAGVNYGILRIGKRMALTYGIGWVGEWLLVGLVIGLVYRPVAAAVKHAAGVSLP